MQPLHDKKHRDAGAVSIGVINHRAVQVDQPLMLGQRPEATHTHTENKEIIVMQARRLLYF